ncbi:hypothetical protein FACS189430_00490 [Bacteroidia bacterium]|nr:hypothetical protein FACS189430_00490 [Bacteroidia bacterium]
MDIYKLFKAVLRKYKIILGSAFLLAALVFVFTMNSSKKFTSSATIYTGINTRVSIDSKATDWSAQSASFFNIISVVTGRETLKEVGLRLFATHLTLQDADPKYISAEHLAKIKEQIPVHIKELAANSDSLTYLNLISRADTDPYLIGIINYPSAYYSISALSSTLVERVMESDMISLAYDCDDPGVCQQTLDLLLSVCIRNYRQMNESQVDKAVNYFEGQLQIAQDKLKESESRLLQFNRQYNLVDYSRQTGLVISQREEIISQINKERELISASEAGIRSIESRLDNTTKNKDISTKREQLTQLASKKSIAELNGSSATTINELNDQIQRLNNEMVQDMSDVPGTSTGSKENASSYVSKIVAYEESKARLKALEGRRDAAVVQYSQFVPLGDTLKKIQREIDINEKEYLAILDELNKSRRQQQDQHSFTSLQVIDKPNYPLTGKSNRKILILMGFFIGGLIPASLVIASAYMNNNIRTLQRAEDFTGLKTGGLIVDIKELKSYKNPEAVNNTLNDSILKTLYLPGQIHEQQRILIVSTRPHEGKTMICNMLCERLSFKGRKCLIVTPVAETGTLSVVHFHINNAFSQARPEDLVPVDKPEDADILLLELPSLITNDYPVEFVRQFNMAFLICNANREWTKADQTALDNFIHISGITPHLILNQADRDAVEDVLGKII